MRLVLLNKNMLSIFIRFMSWSLLGLSVLPLPVQAVDNGVFDSSRDWSETQIERYFSGINEIRRADGLAPFSSSGQLAVAAQNKAEDMARAGYFAHYGPDGKTPWQWLDEAGYQPLYAGENLARNGFDADAVLKAWLASAGHKKNIMNEKFSEMGIGIARAAYEGRETIFVVQMFGQPLLDASLSATSQTASS